MSDALADVLVQLNLTLRGLVAELRSIREEWDRANGGPEEAEES